jgi:MFS family permease
LIAGTRLSSNVTLTARRALAAALAAQVGVSVTEQGLPSLTGFIKEDLHISASASGLIVSALLIGEVVASYGAGSLADRIGERAVMSISTIASGILVFAASPLPIVELFFVLVVAGTFIAAVTPAGSRLILMSVSSARLGVSMGIRQSGVPVGGLAAAITLPAVAAFAGWRTAIATAGLLTALTGILALVLSGIEPRPRAAQPPSPAGRLKGGRELMLATIWACMLVSGQYVVLAFLGLDIHVSTGLSLAVAGVFVATAHIGGIVGRIGWGYVSDRWLSGRSKSLLIALSGVGVFVTLTLALLPHGTPSAVFVVLAFACGLTLIGWQGVWIALVGQIEGSHRAGRSIGFALTFVNLAGFASAPFYGIVVDLSHGFRAMWLTVATVLALSTVPIALLRSPR